MNSHLNVSHTNNKSPLRYPGGKTRACRILDEIVASRFDVKNFDTLISPFFGGGSFEFYMQNKYNYSLVVNDKFTPLYNFWKQVKTDKFELCRKLRGIPTVSKSDFVGYRNSIIKLSEDVMQQSIQYFIINRCSFSGATLSGGFSEEASIKRYTPSSVSRVEAVDMTRVEVHNMDFEDFLNKCLPLYSVNISKCILFLDPPYFLEGRKNNLYGINGDMHEEFDHIGLFSAISIRNNWILTYNNCSYIRDLYKDYTIIEVGWSYGMNTDKVSSEIVIISTLL